MGIQKTVLVVDDSTTNRSILCDILHSDYSVIQAENGIQALTKLKRQDKKVDAIILDIIMPEMDGYEFMNKIKQDKIKHGPVRIAFTPDEEIGAGVDHFDVAKFGADCAYTLDGGEEGEIAYETFNACSAELHFDGLSVHPGSSKDTMINAALVAMEYNALLPAGDIPRLTEGYEGFFHLCDMKGDVEHAELHYIVRDHDRATFEARKKLMEHAVKVINEKYGRSVVTLRLKDSYYNMAEKLTDHMELIENAKRACEAAGMKPFIEAVRGGTDGCRLSYMGLPTPNLCTGGFAFHGPYEHIAVESMDRCTKMVELLMIGE